MLKRYIIILLLCPLTLSASKDQLDLRKKITAAPTVEKIPLLIQLANSYTYISKDSLNHIYREALGLAAATDDPKMNGDVLYQYGFQLYRLSAMDSARSFLKQAYRFREAQKDSTEMAMTLNLLGNVNWFLGEQILAKEHFEKALDLFKKRKYDLGIGRAYTNLANLYRNWGEYPKAIDLFLEASDYYIRANDEEGQAWLKFSITLLYKKLEDYNSALTSINAALQIYSRLTPANSDSNGVMICYGQLGDIYRLLGNYEKALQYHRHALRLRKKTGVSAAIADGLMGIGQIYYEMGAYHLALNYTQQSKELRERSKINSGIVTNLKYLGLINYKLGQTGNALLNLKKSLEMARVFNNLSAQEEILNQIAHIYFLDGKHKSALSYYFQYSTIKDSLNQSKLDKQLSIFKLKTEIKKKQIQNEKLSLQNKIHTLELEKSNALSKILYLTILFFVFIIYGIFYLYKKKYRDNQQLQHKNEEIKKAHHLLEVEIKGRIKIEQEREKLIAELELSLSKIKTLSGLIPICASCKKIRNDQGYYEQIENYISQHTEAQFTHGICPECKEKLFPGLDNDIK